MKTWNEKKTINATKLKKLEKTDQNARIALETITEEFREKVFPNEQEKSEFVYNYHKQHYKNNAEKENFEEFDRNQEMETINSSIENEKKEWVLTVD